MDIFSQLRVYKYLNQLKGLFVILSSQDPSFRCADQVAFITLAAVYSESLVLVLSAAISVLSLSLASATKCATALRASVLLVDV